MVMNPMVESVQNHLKQTEAILNKTKQSGQFLIQVSIYIYIRDVDLTEILGIVPSIILSNLR